MRGHVPAFLAGQLVQPLPQTLFADNQLVGIRSGREPAAHHLLLPVFNAANLLLVQAEVDELEAVLAVGAQLCYQAGRSPLCRRGWIVQFVGQIAGQLAQCGQFLSLLLHARHLAYPVQQRGDDALAHRWNHPQHLRKQRLVDQDRPDLADGVPLTAVADHPGVGQQPVHLPSAADEQRHGPAVIASHVDFALEDENHVLSRSALFKQDFARLCHHFAAVAGQPYPVLDRHSVQRANAVQRLGNLVDGRGYRG